MEFFRHNTTFKFMGIRKWTATVSALVFIISIAGLVVHGLNWGLEFTGGLQMEIGYEKQVDLQKIRQQLNKAGFGEVVVQRYGSSESSGDNILIRLAPKGLSQQKISSEILKALPNSTMRRVEFIGPQVGQQLATKGALALVVSFLLTMLYIALRFEYRFAVSAIVALIHDPVLILGIFAWTQMEFDLNALAAMLAVIGYSLNDTIVVFDRVRENFRKLRKSDALEILDLSINQTLSRTIMTSGLTLIVVVALFIYGGEMIHSFAAVLLIGILIGTYSSIYVAGALALSLGLKRDDMMPTPKAELDDRP